MGVKNIYLREIKTTKCGWCLLVSKLVGIDICSRHATTELWESKACNSLKSYGSSTCSYV